MDNSLPRNSDASNPNNAAGPGKEVSRRQFLYSMAAAGVSMSLIGQQARAAVRTLAPVTVDNPLGQYPERGWEKVYRDLYKSESMFTFLCAPNDTHNCLLNAHVKNGVVTRISPTYNFHKATDLDGTAPASAGSRAAARRAWPW